MNEILISSILKYQIQILFVSTIICARKKQSLLGNIIKIIKKSNNLITTRITTGLIRIKDTSILSHFLAISIVLRNEQSNAINIDITEVSCDYTPSR